MSIEFHVDTSEWWAQEYYHRYGSRFFTAPFQGGWLNPSPKGRAGEYAAPLYAGYLLALQFHRKFGVRKQARAALLELLCLVHKSNGTLWKTVVTVGDMPGQVRGQTWLEQQERLSEERWLPNAD